MPEMNEERKQPLKLKNFLQYYNQAEIPISATISIPRNKYIRLKELIRKYFTASQSSTLVRRARCDGVDIQLNSDNPNLDDSDRRQNELNRKRGSGVYKPLEGNITIAPSQLDDALSDVMSMLVPSTDCYQPFANVTNQEAAQAISTFLSKNAKLFNHFEAFHLAFSDCLKYNWGGLLTEWVSTSYIKWIDGQVTMAQGTEGSKLKRLDPRNTYCQPGIPLSEYSERASFIGLVTPTTVFDVNKLIWDNGLELKPFPEEARFTCTPSYNQLPLIFTNDSLPQSQSNLNSFDAIQFGRSRELPNNSCIKQCWVKLIAEDYDLPPSMNGLPYSVYHFVMVNDEILLAEPVRYCFTGLPVALSASILDGLNAESRSFGEQLLPLQTFINYLYNIHRKAALKRIYGARFYDAACVDMKALSSNSDKVQMDVPVNLPANTSIQSKIMSFNDAPDLSQTSADISTALGLMQKILPTETANLMGGLERATVWQAMKTAREAGKRTVKLARILDAAIMQPIILLQVEACIAYLSTLPAINASMDSTTQIDMSTVDLNEIKFDISSGIQTIDKELTAQALDTLISKIIQVPAFAQQFDVFTLLDGLSAMLGTKIDFSQYKLQSPIDSLPVNQRDAAFQLLQQAIAQAEANEQQGNQVQ